MKNGSAFPGGQKLPAEFEFSYQADFSYGLRGSIYHSSSILASHLADLGLIFGVLKNNLMSPRFIDRTAA